jgi:hypothetical protein
MKHYFLFGEFPCRAYDIDDYGAVIECLKSYEGNVYVLDEDNDSLYDLLDALLGWSDYRVITEQDYLKFKTEGCDSNAKSK